MQSHPYTFLLVLMQNDACKAPPVSYFVLCHSLWVVEFQVDVMPDCEYDIIRIMFLPDNSWLILINSGLF